MTYREVFENEVATNQAGTGAVEGMGVGPRGEPGVDKKKKRGTTLCSRSTTSVSG